jgi:hypothetical protein
VSLVLSVSLQCRQCLFLEESEARAACLEFEVSSDPVSYRLKRKNSCLYWQFLTALFLLISFILVCFSFCTNANLQFFASEAFNPQVLAISWIQALMDPEFKTAPKLPGQSILF